MITGNEPVTPHLTYDNTSGHPNGFIEGITIRQLFANSAPDKIPDWFVHVPPPPISIKRPVLPIDAPEEHREAIRYWGDAIDELPDELKWYEEAWNKYVEALNKWEYDNKKQRYFQWRTFYAENLIAELNKPTTNE